MKGQFNYHQLLELESDIEKQANASPAFQFFNSEKIRRFFKQNEYRLSVLHSTMEKIRKEYVKKDEEGKSLTVEVNGVKEWDFETQDDKDAYLKEWNEFMQITFDVHV